MSYRLYPGPLNGELLYLAENHRAFKEYQDDNGGTKQAMRSRRGDKTLWSYINNGVGIGDDVKWWIIEAGFGGVFDCRFHEVDNALIHALVERWRPETNSFHFPFGEATVTLQDVQVLYGLNVEGPPIIGQEIPNINEFLLEYCLPLLGFIPDDSELKGAGVLVGRLISEIKKTHVHSAEIRARQIILLIIGGTLFADSSNSRVSLVWLYAIKNLTACRQYSWGSAVLACLYRNLYKATCGRQNEVCGPVSLLQLWAWERISSITPERRTCEYQFDTAYGAR